MMTKKQFLIRFIVGNVLLFILLGPFIVFYGPFHSLTYVTVGTILTSRHPQVADFFLSEQKIAEITQKYGNTSVTVEPVIQHIDHKITDEENGIRIENIEGKYFKGIVMLVRDPLQIEIAVTKELGVAGQRLSELVIAEGAIAGINAGGFYDPNSQGNGAYPDGITVRDGQLIHENLDAAKSTNLIGFNKEGKLMLRTVSARELSAGLIRDLGIQHAVSFEPNLILNGEPQIKGDGGWGFAPRTGIGQKADGTVIFVVIDGRQPDWSMGATLRDLMNIFIEYGAENAANLDGGSSTELFYQGRIINKLWNIYGERYMPTAFVVMPGKNLSGVGQN
ncbi:exopolysaccharide biosynthesis protein [Dehalobacter sp. MCB1]|nr:exopolysaccharide biosynthesis protein [Dehalobacter sp. MCB1]TCX50554.1 exopolysaccharide biosynthesis protein [Dehalobacter sp. 14DCB1]TCX52202.1 exopolysaccharide biosynthesis protein [Dehalobacter sp. 12DCB1]